MATFDLEIVTPERTLWSGTVERLRAPGTEGGFGILPGHHPMVASLDIGPLEFTEAGAQTQKAAISGGFAEVLREKVTILAETAEMFQSIDVGRAEAALARARERLVRPIANEIDVERAEIALRRAINRLRAAGKT